MKNKQSYVLPKATPISHYRPIVPIGSCFQAHLPTLTTRVAYKSDDSTPWIGTKVWPVENIYLPNLRNINIDPIGKGRDIYAFCNCNDPGTSECVIRHVSEKKDKLKLELGPAFLDWKFDEMGEEASKNWTKMEEKLFRTILVRYLKWNDRKGFFKCASKWLPKKTREDIVGYYFNVTVLRKIEMKLRSAYSPIMIKTDSDEDETASSSTCSSSPKKMPKRVRKYLTGVR